MRAPPELRFVLTARHDVRLGLHRLRLEGGLAEILADDLKFTLAEGRELFTAAGVELDEPTLVMLHERTEGWAAGLRLAALSLAGPPDPARPPTPPSSAHSTCPSAAWWLGGYCWRITSIWRRPLTLTAASLEA